MRRAQLTEDRAEIDKVVGRYDLHRWYPEPVAFCYGDSQDRRQNKEGLTWTPRHVEVVRVVHHVGLLWWWAGMGCFVEVGSAGAQ